MGERNPSSYKKCGIREEDTGNREMFINKIAEVLSDKEPKKTKRIFSEDQRVRVSQSMKKFWRKRKIAERNYVFTSLDD